MAPWKQNMYVGSMFFLPGVQDRQVKKKMKLSLYKGAGLTLWDEQLIHKANAEPWVPSVPSQ